MVYEKLLSHYGSYFCILHFPALFVGAKFQNTAKPTPAPLWLLGLSFYCSALQLNF